MHSDDTKISKIVRRVKRLHLGRVVTFSFVSGHATRQSELILRVEDENSGKTL